MNRDLHTEDVKTMGAVAILAVISVVLVSAFIGQAFETVDTYNTESDWDEGTLSDLEVVEDALQLEKGFDEGTWRHSVDNDNYDSLATDSDINSDANEDIEISAEYREDGQLYDEDTFTLEDGSEDFDLASGDWDEVEVIADFATELVSALSEEVTAYEDTEDGTEAAVTTPEDISQADELTVTFYNDGELALDEDEGDPSDSEYTEDILELDSGEYGVVIDHGGGLDDVEVDQVEVEPSDSDVTSDIDEVEHHYNIADGDSGDDLSNYPDSQVFDDLTYINADDEEDESPKLSELEFTGEEGGLTKTILDFAPAILAVAGLIAIMART